MSTKKESFRPSSTSILELVNEIDDGYLKPPEFQRDFVWELHQTKDLFDSLARDIFIGSIIFGVPNFPMTCRRIDTRKRRGRRKGEDIKREEVGVEQFKTEVRLILDGQQRATSIYRALTGIDPIYLVIRKDAKSNATLEEMLDEFVDRQDDSRLCVSVHDAYFADKENLREAAIKERFFLKQPYIVKNGASLDLEAEFNRYINGHKKLVELYKNLHLVSFYMLDLSLEKFCAFFERSNSRGVELNFTDILGAKLFNGFNLNGEFRSFAVDHPELDVNKEVIIRAITLISRNGATPKINKAHILTTLTAEDVKQNWAGVTLLFKEVIELLQRERLIISQAQVPSQNMLIPLIVFFTKIRGIGRMKARHRELLRHWFWGSAFATRYSITSNEVVIEDSLAFEALADGDEKPLIEILKHVAPNIEIRKWEDLINVYKPNSSIYKAVMCYLNSVAPNGFIDWNSHSSIDAQPLDDHHIFPTKFIERKYGERYVAVGESLSNRAPILKLRNKLIKAKAPSVYFQELLANNPKLKDALDSYLVPHSVLKAGIDDRLEDFLDERAKLIFEKLKSGVFSELETYA